MQAPLEGTAVRVAKAWRCRVAWSDDADVVHAPTAGKARARLRVDLLDSYPDIDFRDIKVRRAREHDKVLPAGHRLVPELDGRDRQIILHAFGADNPRRSVEPGYRNHFCTHPGDTRLLRLAWELGLFHGPYGEAAYGATPGWAGAFFYLTDLGRHVARSMMKLYR